MLSASGVDSYAVGIKEHIVGSLLSIMNVLGGVPMTVKMMQKV